MPQDEQFWNPYRLVPVRDTVERTAPRTHERFRGHSGLIAGTIENLTPLFVGAKTMGSHHPPLLRNNRRIIPGSSLKGMLRSLTEIVGGGCFIVHNDRGNERMPASPVPEQMKACRNVRQLCIACRMFGAMERGSDARVHIGKLGFGDALIREDTLNTKSLQILLGNNGVRHEPFYRSPQTGVLDGRSRKLYFHQPKRMESAPPVPQNLQERAWNVDALLPGHHFDFEIQFSNLDDFELSLLLYVLCLEENVSVTIGEDNIRLNGPMRHKIGNAKPLGMGSCRIQIEKLTFLPSPEQRFAAMGGGASRILKGEDLAGEIQERTQRWVTDTSPTMEALRKMMVWDEDDPRGFHYPDYYWFKNNQNSGKPLKTL
jgi:hypothetical protein